MKKIVCQSTTSSDTKDLGEKLARDLTRGGTLLLYGDLGAGKTTFVQGLATGLGILERVTSPTFTLLSVYQTKHPVIHTLVHVDLYRITAASEIMSLDIAQWQNNPDVLLVVEWPERTPELWNDALGSIWFNVGANPNERSLTFQIK